MLVYRVRVPVRRGPLPPLRLAHVPHLPLAVGVGPRGGNGVVLRVQSYNLNGTLEASPNAIMRRT